MKKLHTLSMLQDYLDEELSWRLKEVADLKLAIRSFDVVQQKTLIRATVPLLYAHWEGFVKNTSDGYLNFVNSQRMSYNQLASCFVVFGVKRKLNDLLQSRQARRNIAVVDFFVKELGDRANLKLSAAIDTESNLSSKVFENIAVSIGIDPSLYTTKYNLIDINLLKCRNEIAHGQYVALDPDDCRKLADETISLMRSYKTDIENVASLKLYRLNRPKFVDTLTN